MSEENPNQVIDRAAEQVDVWAFVELFGHQKIAGRVTERKLGTEIMFQIDVPKIGEGFAYSRLFNPKAVFSINPTTEEWCRKWARTAGEYNHSPIPFIPETRQIENGHVSDEDREFIRREQTTSDYDDD